MQIGAAAVRCRLRIIQALPCFSLSSLRRVHRPAHVYHLAILNEQELGMEYANRGLCTHVNYTVYSLEAQLEAQRVPRGFDCVDHPTDDIAEFRTAYM